MGYTPSCQNKQEKISNLKTFAKAYGYVKYFHPSDEASSIDWNVFAAYGAKQIVKCNSRKELITTLNNLFKPIAPSVVFSETKLNYDFTLITPNNEKDYQSTYWQHKGVSKDMIYQNQVYKSVRVNRYSEINESASFGNLSVTIDPEKYKGREIKYTGWVKLKDGSKGTGHLWLRVDKSDKTVGFFENMDANPIISQDWKQYEIIGNIDTIASNLRLGCFLNGKGMLYLDDVHLYYKENNNWIEIPIKNSGFETVQIGQKSEQTEWIGKSSGYTYQVSDIEKKEGEYCAVIKHEGKIKKEKAERLFDEHSQFGELIQKEIGDRVYCQIPLNLYSNDENTFPKSINLIQLQDSLKYINGSPDELSTRLGNVINTYNVFQHFYPYFKEAGTDWDKEFETALNQCFIDRTDDDHLTTLQKLTAPLKDGHISVSGKNSTQFVPPISWEWIEDKLVITEVKDENIEIKVGDIVTRINNQLPKEYFNEINTRVSAGTKGWLNYIAKNMSLFGEKDSDLNIESNNKVINLIRNNKYSYKDTQIPIQKNNYKLLDRNIFYLNLDKISMDTITSLLPKLKKAKGIICDLRGYPNGNHGLISHLLKEKDTSKTWMRIPKIIYPDQENITGYEKIGWEIEPKEPYLGGKNVIFIIDGRTISYAESFMSFIEGYKLATIIGQPSAGTNGNINPFKLLGGFSISWTGMKVFKHDGSQHHAIGILPNIYVNRTIVGVKLGEDEFLDKAIEIILEP